MIELFRQNISNQLSTCEDRICNKAVDEMKKWVASRSLQRSFWELYYLYAWATEEVSSYAITRKSGH